MDRDPPPGPTSGARPPRRRNRGRRGGGGGSGGNSASAGSNGGALQSSPPPQQLQQVARTAVAAAAGSDVGAPSGSGGRKPRTRKNRRGSRGGANREAAAEAREPVERGPGEPRSAREPRTRPEVKLAVRRLPPRMSRDEFFEHAGPRGADRAVWTSFYAGGVKASAPAAASKRGAILTRHSTAYLAFAEHAHATAFFRALNGHRYVDSKSGMEYVARVERAMFQVVPRVAYYSTKRPPAIRGTIAADGHYLAFLDRLKAEQDGVPFDGDSAGKSDAPVEHNPATSVLVVKAKPRGIGNGPAAPEAVMLTKLMEDVRNRRRERDERKAPKSVQSTRATRRRGRRAGAAATTSVLSGAGSGAKSIVVKKAGDGNGGPREKPPKGVSGKGSRPSRAAKRAAAAAAAAEAGGTPGGKGPEEGDGVYVVRGPRARPAQGAPPTKAVAPDSVAANALALAAKRTTPELGSVVVQSPGRRRSKPPRAQAPPFPNPATTNRPAIRLLKKEAPAAQSVGASGGERGNGSGT